MSMRHRLLAVSICLAPWLLAAEPAGAVWVVQDHTDATTGQGVNPRLTGDFLTWRGFYAVWLRELPAGPPGRLSPDLPASSDPVAAGGIVAWTSTSVGAVGVYDTATGALTSVGDPAARNRQVATDGRSLVWVDQADSGWEIYLHSLASGTTARLTDDAENDTMPAVDHRHVVWSHVTASGSQLRVHDLVTGATAPLPAPLRYNVWPSVADGRVVWHAHDGIGHVYAHDLRSGVTTQLSQTGAYSQVADYHRRPVLRGSRVAWTTIGASTFETWLTVHDLDTGEQQRLGPFARDAGASEDWGIGFDGRTVAFGAAFGDFTVDCTGLDLLACLAAIQARDQRLADALRLYAYRVDTGTLEEVGVLPPFSSTVRPDVDEGRIAYHVQPNGWVVRLATRDGDDDGIPDRDDDRCIGDEPTAVTTVQPLYDHVGWPFRLTGTGIGPDAAVLVAGRPARILERGSGNLLALVPTGLGSGPHPVVVENPEGCRSLAAASVELVPPPACGLLGFEALALVGLLSASRARRGAGRACSRAARSRSRPTSRRGRACP